MGRLHEIIFTMKPQEETKIRKILFNEIFMIIAILSAVLSPVYTLFSIKTDIALIQQKIGSIIESFEKLEGENKSYSKELVDIHNRITKIETRLELSKKLEIK